MAAHQVRSHRAVCCIHHRGRACARATERPMIALPTAFKRCGAEARLTVPGLALLRPVKVTRPIYSVYELLLGQTWKRDREKGASRNKSLKNARWSLVTFLFLQRCPHSCCYHWFATFWVALVSRRNEVHGELNWTGGFDIYHGVENRIIIVLDHFCLFVPEFKR